MRRSSIRPSGFTLLEVLVALTLLAVSLPALFHALNGQTRQSASLRDRQLAGWVAANTLESARLQHRAGRHLAVELVGEVDMGLQRWHWRRLMEPAADQEMLRVTVIVSDERQVEWARLTGVLARPLP